MTQQLVGLGAAPNDGLGDPLRSGGAKINDNFTELYAAVASGGSTTTVITNVNDWKDAVACATTANIVLTGEQTIDAFPTNLSRVLVKDQTIPAENGFYVSAVGAWARSTDADAAGELTSGTVAYVENGAVGTGKMFMLSTQGAITIGTTPLLFVEILVQSTVIPGIPVTGTTFTTGSIHANRRLYATNAAAKVITIPSHTGAGNVPYPVNTFIEFVNIGAGVLTIAGNTFTPNSASGVLTVPQYHVARAVKRATPNTWEVLDILPLATTAQFRSNTPGMVLSTDQVWASAAEVVLADAATVVVNMSTFLNARLTLADNRTLGTPSNAKVGQSGCIRIIQDAVGGRTLAFNAQWVFGGGTDPVLSTPPNSEDLLFYHVLLANKIFANLVKAIA